MHNDLNNFLPRYGRWPIDQHPNLCIRRCFRHFSRVEARNRQISLANVLELCPIVWLERNGQHHHWNYGMVRIPSFRSHFSGTVGHDEVASFWWPVQLHGCSKVQFRGKKINIAISIVHGNHVPNDTHYFVFLFLLHFDSLCITRLVVKHIVHTLSRTNFGMKNKSQFTYFEVNTKMWSTWFTALGCIIWFTSVFSHFSSNLLSVDKK